jgi:hypothetical protein
MKPLTLNQQKLATLANIEGYKSLDELLEACALDSVSPAIYCNPDNPSCDYTCEVEPDQDAGHCEVCGTQTMKSALILMGVI